jgi:hypothetical protein
MYSSQMFSLAHSLKSDFLAFDFDGSHKVAVFILAVFFIVPGLQ